MRPSSETQALFAILRQSAAPEAADAIESLVRRGSDRALCRVNVLDFAAKRALDGEQTIAGFLNAVWRGLFELTWNVLCPGCGGVLEIGATLKTVNHAEYTCALRAAGNEPTLDETVEVMFTVSPSVRSIAAHNSHKLPVVEFYRQVLWSSGVDLRDDETLARILEEVTLDSIELPADEKASMSLQAPEAFLIVFDPVVHMTQFIEVKGEPTRERQTLTATLNRQHAPTDRVTIRPCPLRIYFENRTNVRTLLSVWIGGDQLHVLVGKPRPFLTAKRLLTNQTFREIYRTDTLDIDPLSAGTIMPVSPSKSFQLLKVTVTCAGGTVRRNCKGLTPFGHYSCAPAGGIDRDIGFDMGHKTLPAPDDQTYELCDKVCRYCGQFIGRRIRRTSRGSAQYGRRHTRNTPTKTSDYRDTKARGRHLGGRTAKGAWRNDRRGERVASPGRRVEPGHPLVPGVAEGGR
jgi:hypothetical protein